MAEEKNLYKMVKEKLKEFNPIRIETSTINGFPDFILFNKSKEVLFIECKVCKSSKLLQSLSPHQKSFHHKYSDIMKGLFILQRVASSKDIFLYRSKNFDFLGKNSSFVHCARAEVGGSWCAIKTQLEKNPPYVVGANDENEPRAENGEK
jgi:hypothetical protein